MNIKFYEEGNFFFEFMPHGSPFEGTLVARYPEHEAYIDSVSLTKASSRNEYAKRAHEECGISRQALKKALNALASKRHEEVSAAAQAGEETGPEDGRRELSEELKGFLADVDLLVHHAEDAELFHTPDGKPHATFQVDTHEETWPVESRRFELYLRKRYFEDKGGAPKAQAVKDAVETISARAMFGGPEKPVFLRIAGHDGAVYVDLCDDAWEAVEITAEGYTVMAKPPVKFVRKSNSAPLPYPVAEGSIEDLRSFLNVETDEDFRLIASWLVGAFNPGGPYPVLELNGQQGSAKSTTVRVLVSLVDPANVPLRAPPREERDLAVAASGSWCLAFDNLSYLPAWLSDALCRLSTGGGFGTRTLYSNDQETLFDFKRPAILNGINQVGLRGDLQERSLIVELPPIFSAGRRREREFWAHFEATRPQILGALFNAVSGALRSVDDVSLEESPRMADFAAWVTAAEGSLGWETGAFMAAYAENREQAIRALLEADPVAVAVMKLLMSGRVKGQWEGTSEDLLEDLSFYTDDDVKRSRAWPKAPNKLSERMNRLAPPLREVGIEYNADAGREGSESRKIKSLKKIGFEAADGEEEHEEQADSDGGGRRRDNPFAKINFDNPREPEDQGAE
jgi:hypothetical protein